MAVTMMDTTAAAASRRRGGKRRGREGWVRLLAGHRASGLTVPQYCAREGVSTASFYRWRSLIGEVHDADSTGERVPAPGRSWSPGTAFLDLGPVAAIGPATDDARIRAEGGLTVRLDLGDGLVLTLSRR